ncbi:MAG: hypothetical protein M3R51_03030 [Candidatus Eremiobacteraeota bacterium]|nr:hypothetical protein [Candidatus Eremiobacteraeota bacterium]
MDVSTVTTGTGAPAPAVIDSGLPSAAAQESAQPRTQPQSTARALSQAGIAPAIAKLFGGSSVPQPIALNVSYRVVKDLDEIVTIFSDPKTGKEVAQFPAEILIGLAQFFDHERGATLDQNA